MGSTNRRPPRIINVPAAPNYDFLNILEFKGLQKTKNPFTAKVNRASELLNVYVDEHSALTTRPRLEVFNKIKDCRVLTDNVWLGRNDQRELIIVENDNVITRLYDTEDLVVRDAWVHNKRVYVIANDGFNDEYYVVKGNRLESVINNENAYIPTTFQGSIVDGEIVTSELECKNLLNSKYYKKLMWDGKTEIVTDGGELVSNDYMVTQDPVLDGVALPYIVVPTKDGFIQVDTDLNDLTINDKTYKRLIFTFFKQEEDKLSSKVYYGYVFKDHYDVTKLQCYNVSEPARRAIIKGKHSLLGIHLTSEENPTSVEAPLVIGGTTGMITPNGELVYSTEMNKLVITKNGIRDNSILIDIEDSSIAGMDVTGSDVVVYKSVLDNIEVQKIRLAFGEESVVKPVCKIKGKAKVSTEPTRKTYQNAYSISPNANFMAIVVDDKTASKTNSMVIIDLDKGASKPIAFDDFVINNVYIDNDANVLLERETQTSRDVYRLINDKPILMYSVPKTDRVTSEGTYTTYSFFYLTDLGNIMGSSYAGVQGRSFNLISTQYVPDTVPKLVVVFKDNETLKWDSQYMHRFHNNFWFYSPENNVIRWTRKNDPTYICEYDFDDIGADESGVTGMVVLSPNTMMIFKKTKTYILTINDDDSIAVTESKADIGNIAINNPIVTTLKDIPTVITNNGFYGFQLLRYVESSDRIAECITERINGQLLDEVGFENTITTNYKYWTLYSIPTENSSHIYVLDNRTAEWFYWEVPIVIKRFANIDDVLLAIDKNGMYKFLTTEVLVDNTPHSMYYDNTFNGKSVIEWKWKSQILPFKSVNYLKRLLSTSFIFADDQYTNEYGIKYRFEAFRKTKDLVNVSTTLDGWVDQVATTTQKTGISKFNFLTIEFSNILAKDLGEYNEKVSYYYNKINIVGLTFKYILMRGSAL